MNISLRGKSVDHHSKRMESETLAVKEKRSSYSKRHSSSVVDEVLFSVLNQEVSRESVASKWRSSKTQSRWLRNERTHVEVLRLKCTYADFVMRFHFSTQSSFSKESAQHHQLLFLLLFWCITKSVFEILEPRNSTVLNNINTMTEKGWKMSLNLRFPDTKQHLRLWRDNISFRCICNSTSACRHLSLSLLVRNFSSSSVVQFVHQFFVTSLSIKSSLLFSFLFMFFRVRQTSSFQPRVIVRCIILVYLTYCTLFEFYNIFHHDPLMPWFPSSFLRDSHPSSYSHGDELLAWLVGHLEVHFSIICRSSSLSRKKCKTTDSTRHSPSFD